MREEVKARIEAAVSRTGDFIIDGFPRKLEQLYILESVPEIQPIYFMLETDPLVCLRRLIQRGRPDDHPDAVATRWRTYEEQTEAMCALLYGQGIELDAELPIEALVDIVAEYYSEQRRG